MKQTNNAIKFLVAQYRAIFKAAYVKGLVSAVVLTAGMGVASQASAGSAVENLDSAIEISDDTKYVAITTDIESSENGISLTGTALGPGAESDKNSIKANVTTTGALKVSGTAASTGLAILGVSKDAALTVGDATIEVGVLQIGAANAEHNAAFHATGTAKLGKASDGNATLDIQNKGTATFDEALQVSGGGTIKMSGTSKLVGATSLDLGAETSKLEIKEGATASIDTPVFTMTSGTLTVSEGASLNIGYSDGEFSSTFTAGAINLDGNLKVAGDVTLGTNTLTTAAGKTATLTANSLSKTGAGAITVNGTLNIAKPQDVETTEDKALVTLTSGSIALTGALNAAGEVVVNGAHNNVAKISATGADAKLSATKVTLEGTGDNESGAVIDVAKEKTLTISKYIISPNSLANNGGATPLVEVKKGTLSVAGNLNVQGTLKVNGSAASDALISTGSDGKGLLAADILDIGKATISVTGSSGKSAALTINQADEENSKLVLAGTEIKLTGAASSGDANLTFKDDVDLNSGKLIVDNVASSNTKLAGELINVNSGTITIGGSNGGNLAVEAKEFNVNDSTLALSGTLSIKNGLMNIASLNAKSTISDKGFLVAGDSGTLVISKETSDKILATGGLAANAGGVVDISDKPVSFSGNEFKHNATPEAKKIVLNGSAGKEATVKFSDLTITDNLAIDSGTLNDVIAANSVNFNNAAGASITAGALKVGSKLTSTGTLTVSGSSAKLILDGAKGSVNSTLKFTSGTNFEVRSGSWTANKIDASDAGSDKIDIQSGASLSLNELSAGTGDNLNVKGTLIVNGSETVPPKDPQGYAVEVKPGEAGHMGVGLAGATISVDGGRFEYGTTALSGMFEPRENAQAELKVYDNYGKFNLTNGGTLALDFSKVTGKDWTFTLKDITDLKKELINGADASTGAFTGGNIDLGDTIVTGVNGTVEQGGLFKDESLTTIDWSVYQGQQNTISNTIINVVKNAKVVGVNGDFMGNVGAVSLDATSSQLDIAGDVSLSNSAINNGKFVSTSSGEAGNAQVKAGYGFTLNGNGEIGTVTLDASNNDAKATTLYLKGSDITVASVVGSDSKTAVSVDKDAGAKFTGTVASAKFTNSGVVSFESDVNVGEFANAAQITAKGKFDAKSFINDGSVVLAKDSVATITALENKSGSSFSAGSLVVNTANIAGNLEAVNVSASGNFAVNDGVAKVNAFSLTSSSPLTLSVGSAQNSGVFEAKTLELGSKNTLKIQGTFEKGTSVVTAESLQKGKAGETLSSSIVIGQNSAFAVGAGLNAEVLKGMVDPFNADSKYGVSSVAYFDTPVTFADGGSLTLGADNLGNSAIVLDGNSALYINGDNLSTDASKPFFNLGASQATVSADGGEIIITGDVKADKYQVFNNSNVTISAVNNNGNIDVSTQNNLLYGVINTNTAGAVDLKVNEQEIDRILVGASAPVRDTILAYAQGYHGDSKTVVTEENVIGSKINNNTPSEQNTYGAPGVDGGSSGSPITPDNPSTGKPVNKKDYTYNNYFLSETRSRGNGSGVEQVSRFGAYAGGYQAAYLVSNTTAEAISARAGMGALNSVTFADNGQGSALWISPLYKTLDSDGFGAQGLNYGVDSKLYGLALGGDVTLSNGIRLGAMFNVGSGDADGNGSASGVKNDFDYFGFGVYGSYNFDKLSLVADITYSNTDNDVTGDNEIEKIGSSFDTTAFSVGLTAQYALSFDGVEITPHAGLRYTTLDMDDYTVKGSGDIAKYDGDKVNIFSIPVGVSVSKDILAGEWTIKPSFDLTLTANMGDDSSDAKLDWVDSELGGYINNLTTKTSTELFDNFTYSASAGVAAKNGNLSFGLGLSYTGSSNTDGYGINANARFVF